MLTVVSVLWVGDFRRRRYGPEWVRRLRNMVARNLSEPHRFVCLSNVDVDGVETIPLEGGYPGWWAKVELFRRDYGDRMLFLDLDSLIVDDLSDMAGSGYGFLPAPHSSRWHGEGLDTRQGIVPHLSSCCIAWQSGAAREIWSDFSATAMRQFRGDQDWMGHVMGPVDTMPPHWFRKLKRCQFGPPKGVKVVASMPWKNDEAAKKFDWVGQIWN